MNTNNYELGGVESGSTKKKLHRLTRYRRTAFNGEHQQKNRNKNIPSR